MSWREPPCSSAYCKVPWCIAYGENVAEDFSVLRADQDAFAAQPGQSRRRSSQRPAGEGDHGGDDPAEEGRCGNRVEDEHPRAGTTIEALAKLPAPFRQGGTVTAGNASGVNDGAAALIIAPEAAMKKCGLTPVARILGGAAAGVAPRIMGIGPALATQKLCARLGLTP
ncbi:hypothetical protein [Mesorhizobium shangrilense]|uniref:Thiolase N-terminal domain-containing protein n=1 Tax=Mesorhizobium shangrilense TaxID=460060 RepID=A0ABV2DQE7_9HYPH